MAELENLYYQCECSHEHIIKLASVDDYNKVFDRLVNDIYEGKILPGMIHLPYYNYVSKTLSSALQEVFGSAIYDVDDYRNTLKHYLDQNLYAFSAAKSYSVVRQYNSLLTDDKGELVSYAKFRSKVADIDTIYSDAYLKTEYEGAIAAAQMADKWETLKDYPALQYRTIGDERVRPEHAALDNMIIAIDDPMLDKIIPVKDWNCRCTMIPAASGAQPTNREEVKAVEKQLNTKPYFKGNFAKNKIVYGDEHPYFKTIKGGIEQLRAESNYGMRSVEQIYNLNELPSLNFLPDQQAAEHWWNTMSGEKGSFELTAFETKNKVLVGKNFKDYIFKKQEQRFKYINNIVDVMQTPDEIWQIREKGVVETRYLKYYDTTPVVLVTIDNVAKTMYTVQKTIGDKMVINRQSLEKIRSGVLRHKNENR